MPIRGGGGAAGGAWTLIAETTLGAPAATVTFAAIPGTYRELALFCHARTDRAAEFDTIEWRANADAGNNYDRDAIGDAVVPARALTSGRAGICEGANSRANTFGSNLTYWPNYAQASMEKRSYGPSGSMGNLSADADMLLQYYHCGWRSTAVITQLQLLPGLGANFVAGCVFTLYGIT